VSSMRRGSWFVVLAFFLSCWMSLLGSLPGEALAGLIPSHGSGRTGTREDDLRIMQTFLERDLVRETLKRYGVPDQVAMDKVKDMTDEDLHRLAAMTDRLPEGSADVVTIWDAVLVILIASAVILVILAILGIIGVGYLSKYIHKKSKASEEPKPTAPEPEPAAK